MARIALQIKISERTVELITKELHRKKLESDYKKRLQIVYYSSLGRCNKDISELLACSVETVRRWRSRWQKIEHTIMGLEQDHNQEKISDIKLMQEVKLALSDAARKGSPTRLSMPEKVRLQALACESPKDYGIPFNCWTHVSLAQQANKMGIKISASYYGILLKKRITTS